MNITFQNCPKCEGQGWTYEGVPGNWHREECTQCFQGKVGKPTKKLVGIDKKTQRRRMKQFLAAGVD